MMRSELGFYAFAAWHQPTLKAAARGAKVNLWNKSTLALLLEKTKGSKHVCFEPFSQQNPG
jgi:hypothetical protein